MNYGIGLILLALAHWAGILLWNWRAWEIYKKRVAVPWRQAIDDWRTEDIAYWKQVAKQYKLQDWQMMVNPIAWIRYWNWKPEGPTRVSGEPHYEH